MKLTIRNTFAKISTLTYCLGTIVHIMGVIFKLPFDRIPNEAHEIVTILAGYAGLGFILSIKKVDFKNLADKIIYGLILFHLSTSALLHAYSVIWDTNDWLKIFGPSYGYFAISYFALFGYYSFRLDRRLKK